MNNKKISVGIIGGGQLGSFIYQSFLQEFEKSKFMFNLYTRSNGFDICKIKSLRTIVNENDIIINCAAYTDIDQAEINKKECRNVNYNAVKRLVDLIKNTNKKFIHISSDYVYGENKLNRPLSENDKCKPCNYYGKTKLLADNYILNNLTSNFIILRPSWVFGPNGNNFIDKIIEVVKNNNEIKIVNDQTGIITSTYLIYKVIKNYIENDFTSGLYNICCGHIPNLNEPTRFDVCKKIIDILKENIKITPCKTSEFKFLAKRQLNSLLDCTKLDNELIKYGNFSRTSWDIELSNYIFLNNL